MCQKKINGKEGKVEQSNTVMIEKSKQNHEQKTIRAFMKEKRFETTPEYRFDI